MKRKVFNTAILTALACLSASVTTGCNKRVWHYNYDNFFGMCELTGEYSNGVDTALTNDAVANKAKIMGVKSFRIWLSPKDLFIVDDEDNMTIKESYYAVIKDHMDKLSEAGVKNFDIMYTTFVFPKDYLPTTGYVVPDPMSEYDSYIRFLNLNGKAAALIKEYLPQTTIIEPGNEPDFQLSNCIHKNGFVFGGSMAVNGEYLFTDDEKASIIDDMCWYCRHYLNEAGYKDTCKVAIPGLTNLSTSPDFLDLMYDRIKSKCLPAGQPKSDTNVDNYFDYLNFHPYTFNKTNTIDQEWIDFYKELYQAAPDHGDDGRPIICTEFGQTDWGYADPEILASTQEHIAEVYVTFFDTIKREFPMVESVYCFRMFTLVHQNVNDGENNFGIFYNPDDPTRSCKAKPAAKAIAKYFNGDDFDVSLLDKVVL